MFIVLLKFSHNRGQAGQYMAGHKEWIQRGFNDGVFLVAGSLESAEGGCVVAHNTSREELRERLGEDPFVVEEVVAAETIEVSANRADARLDFLLGDLQI